MAITWFKERDREWEQIKNLLAGVNLEVLKLGNVEVTELVKRHQRYHFKNCPLDKPENKENKLSLKLDDLVKQWDSFHSCTSLGIVEDDELLYWVDTLRAGLNSVAELQNEKADLFSYYDAYYNLERAYGATLEFSELRETVKEMLEPHGGSFKEGFKQNPHLLVNTFKRSTRRPSWVLKAEGDQEQPGDPFETYLNHLVDQYQHKFFLVKVDKLERYCRRARYSSACGQHLGEMFQVKENFYLMPGLLAPQMIEETHSDNLVMFDEKPSSEILEILTSLADDFQTLEEAKEATLNLV